jgi:putative flippase GtrA
MKMYFKKYILFGGINTVFAYGLFALLLFCNFHYVLATFFAGIASVLSGFFFNKNFVFSAGENSIFKYLLLYVFVYFLNIYIQFLLLQGSHVNGYFAGAISLMVCSLISFFVMKKLVFCL